MRGRSRITYSARDQGSRGAVDQREAELAIKSPAAYGADLRITRMSKECVFCRRHAAAGDGAPPASCPLHERLHPEGRAADRGATAGFVEPDDTLPRAPECLRDAAPLNASVVASSLRDTEIARAVNPSRLVAEARIDRGDRGAVIAIAAINLHKEIGVPVSGHVGEPDRMPRERKRRGSDQRLRHPACRPKIAPHRTPKRDHIAPRVLPAEHGSRIPKLPSDNNLWKRPSARHIPDVIEFAPRRDQIGKVEITWIKRTLDRAADRWPRRLGHSSS
jgi:hypothetical protein